MTDERDLLPTDDQAADDMPEDSDETLQNSMDQVDPAEGEPITGPALPPDEDLAASESNDYALLSSDALDDALEDLETYDASLADAFDDDAEAGEPGSEPGSVAQDEDQLAPSPPDESATDTLETLDDDERLRGPRAQSFRRRRRNRIAFLPLALYLIGIGAFLIAREQDVANLPNPSVLELGVLSVLAGAFTMIFHAVLFNRHERGLLFTGLWLGVTVGLIAALIYLVEDQPNAVEWWPLLVGAVGITLIVNYVIEPTHDARLIWVAVMCLLATGIAYGFTSDRIDEEAFSALADYWPLLISVIGIGLVPLVFRRHME